MAIFDQVVNAFKTATNAIMDFERENSKLAAILGTTADGVKGLTDEARRLGAQLPC